MNMLKDLILQFLSFKVYVMLPILMLVIALFFRMKLSKALIACLKIGSSFAGIFVIFDFFIINIGSAIKRMIEVRGLNYPVLDIGWPSLAAVAWTSEISVLTIPLILAVNLSMLKFKLTSTIDIDIWNYWHFAFTGVLVYRITGNIYIGLFFMMISGVIVIKLADWSAPLLKKQFNIKGLSIPSMNPVTFFPWGLAMDAIIDYIPYIRKININPKVIKEKVGILGEPGVIGFLVGIFIGIIAAYPVKKILETAVNISMIMMILPQITKILGEGFMSISESIMKVIGNRMSGGKDYFIGVDINILLSNSAVLVNGLILIPIALLISFILPGNRMIPLADLVNIFNNTAFIVLACKENIFRSVLISIPVVVGNLLIASKMAPLLTGIIKQANTVNLNGYIGLVSVFVDGGNPLRYLFIEISKCNVISYLFIPVLLILLFISWRKYKQFENKI